MRKLKNDRNKKNTLLTFISKDINRCKTYKGDHVVNSNLFFRVVFGSRDRGRTDGTRKI